MEAITFILFAFAVGAIMFGIRERMAREKIERELEERKRRATNRAIGYQVKRAAKTAQLRAECGK